MNIQIINATLEDLERITQIQATCYDAEFIEDPRAFATKLMASSETCWLALSNWQTVGYLVSVPVHLNSLPSLNALSFQTTAAADALYLHDLAIHPDFRASGAGRQLIHQFKQQTAQLGYKNMLLIAVQDSAAYWQGHGFKALQSLPDAIAKKVSSFGHDALLMGCSI